MKLVTLLLIGGLVAVSLTTIAQPVKKIDQWLTRTDRSALFQQQPNGLQFNKPGSVSGIVITVDPATRFQVMDGFGFALTGGSAQHLISMDTKARGALLRELFGADGNNIGISYIRLSIGASDLNEQVFSYNDLPKGESDTAMKKFDLGPDKVDVIPVMKEILRINPAIKILASPWSPPSWMKTIFDTRGGRLQEKYYAAYAKYFVRYVQDMKKEGIIIDAVTVQNEPLHPGNNPSILIPAPDMAAFVRDHLGPAFKRAGIKTKIIIYDHNCDRPDYPISILDDPEAKKFIDGSGFHLYGGKIEAMTDVHNAHPDRNIYFTEQMVVDFGRGGVINTDKINISSPVSRLMVGATRNWSKSVILWNLAADKEHKPFTDRGGCTMCQGAVTIDGNNIGRNLAYYAMAHASKFVRPGAVRIASNEEDGLENVAFTTPEGKVVLIVTNTKNDASTFTIKYNNTTAVTTLDAGAAATYVWSK